MEQSKILDVSNLTVTFPGRESPNIAVDNISFELYKGEILGIVGESGSGKSVTALSLLGLVPATASVHAGHIHFQDKASGKTNLHRLDEKSLRKIRGREISMIFQEPVSSLNPVFTCGNQVKEMFTIHKSLSRRQAKIETLKLFEKVELPDPEKIYHAYPHQISGGQAQRVMIAMSMACQPGVLLADEPTTALDVTIQKNILSLMKEMRDETGTSIIFISHDLGVIAEIADRVLVMYKGKIVERGNVWDIFSHPQHPYTKGLLACRPRTDLKLNVLPTVSDFLSEDDDGRVTENSSKYNSVGEAIFLNAETKTELVKKRMEVIKGGPLIKIRNLKKYYPIKKGVFGKISGFLKAVDNISFDIYPGETIGLVGESGCGKTTLGRTMLRLLESTDGKVFFEGQLLNHLPENILRPLRKDIQIIFQDPYASLNPMLTVGEAIMEPMRVHKICNSEKERHEKVVELLEKVNLKATYVHRYPHQFSGGQRQRICIARALALNPKFIVCDEPVSALDVSVQAQVLNLLNELKKEYKFTFLFISHDLSVVKFIADRILVMKDGRLVEMGYPDALFSRPKHSYTKKLIDAIPAGHFTGLTGRQDELKKIQLKRKLEERK